MDGAYDRARASVDRLLGARLTNVMPEHLADILGTKPGDVYTDPDAARQSARHLMGKLSGALGLSGAPQEHGQDSGDESSETSEATEVGLEEAQSPVATPADVDLTATPTAEAVAGDLAPDAPSAAESVAGDVDPIAPATAASALGDLDPVVPPTDPDSTAEQESTAPPIAEDSDAAESEDTGTSSEGVTLDWEELREKFVGLHPETLAEDLTARLRGVIRSPEVTAAFGKLGASLVELGQKIQESSVELRAAGDAVEDEADPEDDSGEWAD